MDVKELRLKVKELGKYSDMNTAQNNAVRYLGNKSILFISDKKNKKYMIYDPVEGKYVHFGQMGYEDYTKHRDEERRLKYLARASKLPGNWKENKYSASNLSLYILWR